MFARRDRAVLSEREVDEARRRGEDLARACVARYGTADALELVKQVGARLVYRRWPPVTAGDCDPQRALICVNLAAVENAAAARGGPVQVPRQTIIDAIVAHELGHLFDWRDSQSSGSATKKAASRAAREVVAHRFAESLLNLPFGMKELENIWRTR